MDAYISGENVSVHVPNVEANVCHVMHKKEVDGCLFIEGTTEDGMRVTLRLSPMEAQKISDEFTVLDNEMWEAYKASVDW